MARDDEDDPERWAGTGLDVRVVVARMSAGVKDGFLYDRVPWGRFRHAFGPGSDVPGNLERCRRADADDVEWALGRLWKLRHQGETSAPASLAVPFLLRIAADSSVHLRSDLLFLVACVARADHTYAREVGLRGAFLRVARRDDDLYFDCSGHVQNWSVRAARDAIAADVSLLKVLLENPDPDVRVGACHVLAAASGRAREISAVLHARLRVEDDAGVRAGLVLAIAQLAFEHPHAPTIAWLRACVSSVTRPLEVRVAAAIAWVCLVRYPVPHAVRVLLEEPVTGELDRVLSSVPCLRNAVDDEAPWVRGTNQGGVTGVLRRILDPQDHRRIW